MKLQDIVQSMLEKFGLLDQFNDINLKSVLLKLRKNNDEIVLSRDGSMIRVVRNVDMDGKKICNSVYNFTLQRYNTTWRPLSMEEHEMRIQILNEDDQKPLASCRGYLSFKVSSNAYQERLQKEDWFNAEVIEKTVEGKDLLVLANKQLYAGLIEGKPSLFQRIVDKILKKHGLLEQFYDPGCNMVYLKLHQECYLDLVIEREWNAIMIGHYRVENGDLISDPIMRYQLVPRVREWDLVGIEQVFGDSWVYHERDGKKMVDLRLKRELKGFANMFARNIKDQDWLNADVVSGKYENTSGDVVDILEKPKEKESCKQEGESLTSLFTSCDGQVSFAF